MNQIIEHRKLNKKEKMILTNHLIKVCRDLHWIETDSDKAVFITEPFSWLFFYFSFEAYYHNVLYHQKQNRYYI